MPAAHLMRARGLPFSNRVELQFSGRAAAHSAMPSALYPGFLRPCRVDLARCGGFLARSTCPDCIAMIEKNYQPADIEGRMSRIWEESRRVQGRPARAPRRQALHHRDPAAERDGLAAYGARAQQHAAGHSLPLRADARPRRAVAARHRSRRHRDPDGGRAAIDGAAGAGPPRHGPRQIPRTGLAMEGRERRRHRQSAEAARRLLRLVARTLHDGRGPVARGRESVRRTAPRRADLQGQAAGELGSETADRDFRSRSAADRGQGQPVVSALSARRQDLQSGRSLDLHRRRHHAAGDHARRHRGRGASGRRALHASGRQARHPAAGRPQDSDRRRRIFRSGKRLGRGEDHAGARLQRFRGRPAAQPAADQRARSGGPPRAGRQRGLSARIAGRLGAACRGIARRRSLRRAQADRGAAGRFRLPREDRAATPTWCRMATAPASSSSRI